MDNPIPGEVLNWIGGKETPAADGRLLDKLSPHNGRRLCRIARSGWPEVEAAVAVARAAQPAWAATPPVQRGHILHQVCNLMEARAEEIARIVALETGKSLAEARGETGGAIALGRFYAGEGQRLYGRTTTSGTANKYAMTLRMPCGVAGLIIAANTPIANVAWKVFPALICGNGVVLKCAEDTPATGWIVAKLAEEAGLPPGVLNVIQGLGIEAGAPLAEQAEIDVLSFTGSSKVGRQLAEAAGRRLLKVSMELGGKNPLVVCDDADLEHAVKWASLSAFSNAGQRCAAASRFIVFESVYDKFRDMLVAKAESLKLGPEDGDDLGPVINQRQMENMLGAVEQAVHGGAKLLCGGRRSGAAYLTDGYYVLPTLLENVGPDDPISTTELFGPIACMYPVPDFPAALELANRSPYGLTACIHTTSFDRAMEFTHKVRAGVAVVNMGTYGSEPHMPFGGVGVSGNGTREPGTEALDIYSELKDVYLGVNPQVGGGTRP
ncbi:MAG: aldehyde dehydrogenase family protein [Desulfarculaceae bacterium]|nr:aldehyde dehydrogenase family protein [Desulfarculaceae bacterium]